MKKSYIFAACLSLLSFGGLSSPTAVKAEEFSGIKWAKSVEEVNQQATESGKLIMADFYTDWCGYCKKLDAETFTDPRVALLSEEFVTIKINAEKGNGPTLARNYGVTGFPNIIFTDPSGKEVEKIGGYMPAKSFSMMMARTLQKHSEQRMVERVKSNSEDTGAIARLAVMYFALGDVDKAVNTLDQADAVIAKKPDTRDGRLAAAYDALGAHFLERNDFRAATGYMQKVSALADELGQLVLGRLKLAYCYTETGEKAKAIAEVKSVLEIKDLKPREKKLAEEMLATAEKMA